MESRPVETVHWINRHEFPGRLKKIRIALYEAWRQSTYIDPEEIPFTTMLPVGEIDTLKDQGLQDALYQQVQDIQTGSNTLTTPVATIRTRQLSHVWTISLQRRFPGENY